MKAPFEKREILIWFIVLVPFAFSFYYWNQFPEQVPVHWEFHGNANGYGSRFMGAFFMPLLNTGLYFLFLLVPRIDPKKANYAQFETTYFAIRLVIHSFMAGIFIIVTLKGVLNYPIDLSIPYLIEVCLAFLFLVFGNFMGRIKPNYMVGIRTPSTLANDEVWMKTHRATGKVWVVVSLAYLVAIFLSGSSFKWFLMVYTGILVGFPLIYSYVIFRRIVKPGN